MQTNIAGIDLECCIYNASGPHCTTYKELVELDKSEAGAVLTKSCTVLPRTGNVEPRYWDNDIMSINSTGLANKGYRYYHDFVGTINKPYIISISGLTLDDNIKIISDLTDNPPTAIELNLSCPNIEGKQQVAYDYDAMEEYLRMLSDVDSVVPIGVKLSPYFDQRQFIDVAELIGEYPVKFVTCINSLGFGLMVDTDTETTVIKPNSGHGGVGGRVVLPIALSNVKQFRELLPSRIDVVGCGGVCTGADVFNHILVGAKAVQVGTQLMKEGPTVFKRLKDELAAIMIEKGYKSIDDFYCGVI